jgi:hypothetical protein
MLSAHCVGLLGRCYGEILIARAMLRVPVQVFKRCSGPQPIKKQVQDLPDPTTGTRASSFGLDQHRSNLVKDCLTRSVSRTANYSTEFSCRVSYLFP